jgi:hypothetical protein
MEDEMNGMCSTQRVDEKCIKKNLVRKSEGKTPLGRPRYRWDDNINMYLMVIGYENMS